MTYTDVQPTAGKFENQETADHSSQSMTSAVVKMKNWKAAEIKEMIAFPRSL